MQLRGELRGEDLMRRYCGDRDQSPWPMEEAEDLMRLRRPGSDTCPDRRPDTDRCPDRRPDTDAVESAVLHSGVVQSLARLIRRELRKGDIIGVTFLVEGTAVVFVGQYQALEGYVLVVKNLFIDHTTSFVPLSDIASIEIGCGLRQAAEPIRLPGEPV